ncbi:endonuclease domain-containing protein [Nocardioides pinisoli]|uniref:Endonuclease domain-containing protein n=1 Tax=Nocardioides pinisoli TaxID=2950279 RepID=A0ABT1KT47_9ACTN|nr:endonuclease domain-containing protein [Nocardioides pinisoli]MCP3420930.1 endonuclease domain-containing protein [Nocardioides pinisoli]
MDAVSALTRLGGIGSTADLLELTTRKRLRRAVADRTVVHVSRGRYALPSADLARSLAAEIDGHLRLLSAAAHWGWESKWPAPYPQLGVARRPDRPVEAEVFVGEVPRRDIDGWATSRVRTVLDCAAALPFDEALAVADSALRHGDVTRDELEAAMSGDPRVRRVVAHATELAANPFESVLRAILVEAGIAVVPQWETTIGRVTYHPDLAEPFAGLAIEANSWRFHAGKADHDADCRRYNALVIGGWTVLRFTWEQVMFSPWEVVAAVRGAMALPCRGLGAVSVA